MIYDTLERVKNTYSKTNDETSQITSYLTTKWQNIEFKSKNNFSS